MTKEKLYKKLLGYGMLNDTTLSNIMNEFFESNICIPKGINRHPYADVYHEAVEGKEWQWSEDGKTWRDVVPPKFMYRIKPLEPVYEWQWGYEDREYSLHPYYKIIAKSDFFTNEEASEHLVTGAWVRIEETKRERK